MLSRFTAYTESTAADWEIISRETATFEAGLADRVLATLGQLSGHAIGHPVDRLTHSLQTATRAQRDGADEETVVCALLHDIGDDLAPANHGPLAAAILQPFVTPENAWMVHHHEVFQGRYFFHHIGLDPNAFERHRGHPAFEMTARFCERWDQASFDPDFEPMPLAAFEPMVHRLFARTPYHG